MRPAGERPAGTRRRDLLAATLALAAGAARANTFDLPALMALLARRRSGRARFTEERTVAALDTPLQSAGVLAFSAPDRFTRQTTSPRAETMEIAGNQLTWTRGGRTRQMNLDAMPEAALMLDALRGTLAGDARLLQRHFEAKVAGAAAQWTLMLQPRDPALAAQVRQVQIVGQQADLRSVEVQLGNGDRSLMQIEPLPDGPAASPAAPSR